MFDIRENLKKIPDTPGVYLHKDRSGQIIYIGKARSLKNRVRQYFQSSGRLDPKTRAMVSHIAEFEYITTGTEMEALLLECNLIKKHMPKYNILLRDDKTFPYIKITMGEEWPRLVKTRKVIRDGGKYFGPYADVSAVNQIIDLFSSIYKLKACGIKSFPVNPKPCLNFHIDRCKGICTGEVEKGEYMYNVGRIAEFLSGRDDEILKELEKKMEEKSAGLEFEEAAILRDQIGAIKAIMEKQSVSLSKVADMDVLLTIAGQDNFGVVFFVRDGKLSGRESFPLPTDLPGSREEMTTAFLEQYYSDSAVIPKEILVEMDLSDKELLERWLSNLRGGSVKINNPKRGEKHALIELAKKDARQMEEYFREKARNQKEKSERITSILCHITGRELPAEGLRIEAYDISNTGGMNSVGAMVVFEDGRPVPKSYRRFKISTVEGADDVGSLQEVIYRRMKRGLSGDSGFDHLPNLILVDGGKNQVKGVEKVLYALKSDIPVLGMVKDDRHRTRGIVFGHEEFNIKKYPFLYHYIGLIQETVHRYAIEYHRGLRTKKMKGSILDDVDGIGEKRRNALLNHFGSIEAIAGAEVEELSRVQGMNRPVAENLKKHLHNLIVEK
ncbi:MAG: excinuclease ABC subunit UvrC [Anaerovoracaceae bacterium]|jgi:excinuclease ABC subunit C